MLQTCVSAGSDCTRRETTHARWLAPCAACSTGWAKRDRCQARRALSLLVPLAPALVPLYLPYAPACHVPCLRVSHATWPYTTYLNARVPRAPQVPSADVPPRPSAVGLRGLHRDHASRTAGGFRSKGVDRRAKGRRLLTGARVGRRRGLRRYHASCAAGGRRSMGWMHRGRAEGT